MYGFALKPVMIAGPNGHRSPIFSAGANDVFGRGAWRPAPGMPGQAQTALPQLMWGPTLRGLGQTAGQKIYDLAKRGVAQFDSLVERTKKIANKSVREQIADEFGLGEPGNKDKAYYTRNAVENNIREAESYTPVNYLVFEAAGPAKNRPGRLEDFNGDFNRRVKDAEAYWGVLPEPQIIERIVQVPGGAAAAPASPLVPILIVGGLAVAGLALLGVFSGK